MNIRRISFIISILLGLFFMKCSKTPSVIISKPILFITLKDSAGRSVSGATVRLYKNAQDSGVAKISDSIGFVKFYDLDVDVYHWYAQKGCATNRNSQSTPNTPLVPGSVVYGYSVMYESGALKIINTSMVPYKVSDPFFDSTITNGTPYIAYPKVGTYIIHSELVSTSGNGKDTLIKVQCGDTSVLKVPY